MACVTSSNPIRPASSTASSIQQESLTLPLPLTTAASTHEFAQTAFLPGVPFSEGNIIPVLSQIPASSPSTKVPNLFIETAFDHLEDMRKIQDTDEAIYEGAYKDGKYHGDGKLTLPNGNVYVGPFANGMYDGSGILKHADGTILYDGQFKKGKYHGHGTIKNSDGTTYTGTFEEGLVDGKGELTLATGEIFKGIFKAGNLLEDKVEILFNNGYVYIGPIKNYMPHGFGKQFSPNRAYMKGQFKDGKLDGLVKFYYSNGEYDMQMQFKDGEAVDNKTANSNCCIIL